ncbi:MAG: eukaryotic-like serine/threonine-protein kinase [Acidobacteriaceae bacterium]|nr:eukaryotic-like serine/threonine-protein kinase [Acidobacteriaceae bacterium]
MIGQTISHYRIHAKLGEGGMGAVYRAEDLTLGRDVALKFLPADTAADPQARKRLLKEAQAASRLNHPNIATIYEVNATENTPFISMELVIGETLKQTLLHAAPTPAQFVSTARQIAEGLREAHRSGVYHRDIKPGNIMLDSRSRVKILDFGLAELGRHERTLGETEETFATRTSTQNTTGGTVPYMSPEQLRGEPADARSDIFSYGVLLYECLTGRLPFQGETSIDILYAILRAPYTPLRTLVPDADPEWEKLIDRCLAKSPAQRCASMEEVLKTMSRMDVLGRIPSRRRSEKSIAVLYFANLSGNKEDEYFRDGMTEDIITELTKIKELQLLPRSAVLAFRDKPLPAAQIGQQLAAAYVLDGSLRRAGNRLRITAQLAETRSGHSIWAERYDRQLEDVFAIQDEIAQNIARALRVMLSDKEVRDIEKVPTRDVQAYDYYLRGRQVFFQLRRNSLEYARQMFARAIVIDPTYAAAFAGVANCSSFLYMYIEATQDNLREAATASRRAVELDHESAEAHASRGLAEALGKNYQEAEKEFEAATRLNPQLYDAFYFYGRSCFAQGSMEKAAVLFRKASELDPADYQSLVQLEQCLRTLDRKQEARQANEDALRVVERHIQLHPGDARALYLGAGVSIQLGDRDRALEWAQRALAIDPEETAVLYNLACTYTHLGETDEALDLLEKAVRNGFGHKEWIENDPDFISLRDHPRYRALIQSLSTARTESHP